MKVPLVSDHLKCCIIIEPPLNEPRLWLSGNKGITESVVFLFGHEDRLREPWIQGLEEKHVNVEVDPALVVEYLEPENVRLVGNVLDGSSKHFCWDFREGAESEERNNLFPVLSLWKVFVVEDDFLWPQRVMGRLNRESMEERKLIFKVSMGCIRLRKEPIDKMNNSRDSLV